VSVLSGARTREEIDRDLTIRLRSHVTQAVRRIARDSGCTAEDIYGTSRHPIVARARRRAMAVLRWSTTLSLPELGRIFNRDHTSVLTAVRKYEDELNAPEVVT